MQRAGASKAGPSLENQSSWNALVPRPSRFSGSSGCHYHANVPIICGRSDMTVRVCGGRKQ
jgi:hypothetical protein